MDEIGVDMWKTLSWDLNNYDLHQKLQKTRKDIYVSTGMSSIEEIFEASKRINNVVFIHTQLNDLIENANLKALNTIRKITNKPTAFGLHCPEHQLLYCSISFEPSALFFYVKDESNKEHPDDRHALSIKDVENYASNLRSLSETLGDGKKYSLKNKLHPDDDDICR